jgi:hypothetical protein
MAWRNVRSSDPRKKAIVAALIEQGFNETGQRGTKVTSVKERHGGRFHGDVLVYQSHCNRAVWLRLGHFEVSLAGQSENGYPQVIPTAKPRWTPSEDGYTETRCGRFRIEPNWYGRTRPVSYSLYDREASGRPVFGSHTQADCKSRAARKFMARAD